MIKYRTSKRLAELSLLLAIALGAAGTLALVGYAVIAWMGSLQQYF